MNTTGASTSDSIDESAVRALADRLRGPLLRPGEPEYDAARQVWNAMIDRRPALIARCMESADVVEALGFARDHDLLVAVRGGGHNVAGNAVCDGGMMIDLSPMNSAQVDPKRKTARVEAGATLGDFDREAQAFGLATPLGINATTGVAGLTLGGGFGWLSRAHGLSVDNLLAADVVTASGELVHASEEENSDLFWAIRGGGGNFGVVTSFDFELHDVGPEVLSGPLVFAGDQTRAVLEFVREFQDNAPDEVVAWPILRKAPPLPFLPEDVHGTDVVIVAAFYAGDVKEGERALAPLRRFGNPIADAIAANPYSAWQQAFDPLMAPGLRNYWKAHNLSGLSDGAIDTALEYAATLPGPHCEIIFIRMGGAINRVPAEATAYPHRDHEWMWDLHTRWEDPSKDDEMIGWARSFFDDMAPFGTGGTYVNFISETEGEENRAYRSNYERLARLKAKYDPDNFFRLNQNVVPREEVESAAE